MEVLPKTLLNKYRLPLGVFLILAIVAGGGVLALTQRGSKHPEISISEPSETTPAAAPPPVVAKIKVDISGAVASPGVYELPENSRVEDALNAAGGFSEQVDKDWVAKNLNLAAKLSDGDKLYIPKVGETSTSSSATNESAPASGPPSAGVVSGTEILGPSNCSRVNINTASAAVLDECLSGIGPAYAQRIIEYRESHGGFKSIEEIQEVHGIGPKTFEKIKSQITVD